jgi:hypothetical protein
MNNTSENTTLNATENTTLNATDNTALNATENTTLHTSHNTDINAIIYDIFNHSQHNLLSHSDILPLPLLHAFASYFANLLIYSNLILPSHLFPFLHIAFSSHSLLRFHYFHHLFLHNFSILAFQGTCGSLGRTLPFSEKSKYNRQMAIL